MLRECCVRTSPPPQGGFYLTHTNIHTQQQVIAAPKDATVESVARAVGDLVQEGVALISLKA